MPDTHGFQVIAAVSEKFLHEILKASWESGGKTEQGTIRHSYDIPAGTTFGSFTVKDGHVEIQKDKLKIGLVPPDKVKLTVAAAGHAELQTAGLASIKLQDITADVEVTAPVEHLTGPGHGPHDVGVNLVPPPTTTVKMTGQKPDAKLDQLMVEQLRLLAKTLPNLPALPGVTIVYKSKPAYTATELLELLEDTTHQIEVVKIAGPPPRLILKVPVLFSCYSIVPIPDPETPPVMEGFAAEAKLVVDAKLEDDPTAPGGYLLKVNAPGTVIDATDITPTGAVDQFTRNGKRLGVEFDNIVRDHIIARGKDYLKQLGDLGVSVPTVASIENSLADFISKQLSTDVGFIPIWPPKAAGGLALTISNVKARVFSDSMVLAINADSGADENLLGGTIPFGRDLAFVISAAGLQNIFEQIKQKENLFRRYSGDGHDFDLKSLSIALKTGAIHLEGSMTVIDAILCFDVDATFTDDVHLSWGSKGELIPKADTPDVDTDLSIAAWVITLIIGFLTLGGVGVVIAAIIDKICEEVAANIGTDIVEDPSFTAVAAWPNDLPKIGDVKATFDNPIDIDRKESVFQGRWRHDYDHEQVCRHAGGSRRGGRTAQNCAGDADTLTAGNTHPSATHEWDLGDGTRATGASVTHTYPGPGFYIVKLSTTVNQPGGARTRDFAELRVENAPPVVDAGPPLTVDEGTPLAVAGSFTDKGWLDKHTAEWFWGDNDPPQPGTVVEKSTYRWCTGRWTRRIPGETRATSP